MYQLSLPRKRKRKYSTHRRKHYILARLRNPRPNTNINIPKRVLILILLLSPATQTETTIPTRCKPNTPPFTRSTHDLHRNVQTRNGTQVNPQNRTRTYTRTLLYVIIILLCLPHSRAMENSPESKFTSSNTAIAAASSVFAAVASAVYTPERSPSSNSSSSSTSKSTPRPSSTSSSSSSSSPSSSSRTRASSSTSSRSSSSTSSRPSPDPKENHEGESKQDGKHPPPPTPEEPTFTHTHTQRKTHTRPDADLSPNAQIIGDQVLITKISNKYAKHDDHDGPCQDSFRTYLKNTAGTDLTKNEMLHDTLCNMYDAHIDATALIHLSDGGNAMSSTNAAEIERLVEQWTPPEGKDGEERQYYQAYVAYDKTRDEVNPKNNDSSAASLCIIIRSDATIRSTRPQAGGRLLHLEILANNHKSVHLVAAYPRPGPYGPKDWHPDARHRRLVDGVTNIFKKGPTGQDGLIAGPVILLTDANSVWYPIERGATSLSPQDGEYSLAANLKKIGAITCFTETFDIPISAPVYTFNHFDHPALLDHTVLHSRKAYRKYHKRNAIDNGDNIISGSDHRGHLTEFHFKKLFSTPKHEYYKNHMHRPPSIGLPSATQEVAKRVNKIIKHNQPYKDELEQIRERILNLDKSNFRNDKLASELCGQTWDCIVKIYHDTFHTSIKKHKPHTGNTRTPTSMAMDKERKALRTIKKYKTALIGTKASLSALCNDPRVERESIESKLAAINKIHSAAIQRCTDYESPLPPLPPMKEKETQEILQWGNEAIPIIELLRRECTERVQRRRTRNAAKHFQKIVEGWRAKKKGYMKHLRDPLGPPDFSVEEKAPKIREILLAGREGKSSNEDETKTEKYENEDEKADETASQKQTFSSERDQVQTHAANIGYKHCQHSKCPDGMAKCIHFRNFGEKITSLNSILDPQFMCTPDEESYDSESKQEPPSTPCHPNETKTDGKNTHPCPCMHIAPNPPNIDKLFPFRQCDPRSAGKCKEPYVETFTDSRNRPAVRTVPDAHVPRHEDAEQAHRLAKPVPVDGTDGLTKDETIPQNWAADVMKEWTLSELDALLNKSSTKGSKAGISGVSARFLKYSPPYIKGAILLMFQSMQDFSIIPPHLARGLMTPLRKSAGKPRLEDCRPITLLEDPMKIFTKGLANRVMAALKEFQEERGRPLLSSLQTGFVFNSDCITALWPLLHTLEDANKHNKELHLVSIDIRRAYDSIESYSNELASRRLHMPEQYISLMRSFDETATTATRTPFGPTDFYPIERGVRQGDSLSPLRFVLWLDAVMCEWDRQENHHTYSDGKTKIGAQAYVDDTMLFASTREAAQERLDTMARFLASHGLQINTTKTVHIWLNTPKGTKPLPLQIRVWDHDAQQYRVDDVPQLGPDDTFKYLGVLFTASLNFNTQWKRIQGGIHLMINKLFSQRLTPAMVADAINVTIIPCITWSTQVAFPSEDTVKKWDAILTKRVNQYLRTHYTGVPENDPTHLPKEMGGLNVSTIQDTLLKLQIRNLKTALNSSHNMLRNTTRAAWLTQQAQKQINTPMIHRLHESIKQELGLRIQHTPREEQEETLDKLLAPLRENIDLLHVKTPPPLIHDKYVHTNPLHYTFTSDGSIEGTDCGCSLVKIAGPKWGGINLIPLIHSNTAHVQPTPYQDPLTKEQITLEVRRTKLTSNTIKNWPSALAEAWPILQAMVTTPTNAHILIYTDCQINIDNWNRTIISTPSDVQWDGVKDRWIWEKLIKPRALARIKAGGGTTLRKIRSHAHEKKKEQHEALNALSDTADQEANLARVQSTTHQTVDIDIFRKACVAEYDLYDTENGNIPLRESTSTFAKNRFAQKRLDRVTKQSFRGQAARYIKSEHACADASRGGIDFAHWHHKSPISPGFEDHTAKFVWQCRAGPLHTIKVILRSTTTTHRDLKWFHEIRTHAPPTRELGSTTHPTHLCTSEPPHSCRCEHFKNDTPCPTRLPGAGKALTGPDLSCFCNVVEIADRNHVLRRCPLTKNNYTRMLINTATYIRGIGRPYHAEFSYQDPSIKASRDPHLQRHVEQNTYIKIDLNNGIASVVLPAPPHTPDKNSSNTKIRIRADVYLKLIHKFEDAEHIHDICLQSAFRDPELRFPDNPDPPTLSPIHIPHPFLQWFRDHLQIHMYHVPQGQITDASPIAFTAIQDIYPPHSAFKKARPRENELKKKYGVINLLGAPTHITKRYIRAATKAASTTDSPVRNILIIGGNRQHNTLKGLRKKHGAKLITFPPGRFPQVTQFEWLHKAHTMTRDADSCPNEQVSFIIFQNDMARRISKLRDHSIPNLRSVVQNNIRGGGIDLIFRYFHYGDESHTTTRLAPEIDPTSPQREIKKHISPLRPIQNWLILPRPDHHDLLTPPTEIKNKLKQPMEVKLQENTDIASQLLMAGLAPAHLHNFLATQTQTKDPKHEARALTAVVMTNFKNVWQPYHDAIESNANRELNALPPETAANTSFHRPKPEMKSLVLRATAAHKSMRLPCEGSLCTQNASRPRSNPTTHLCARTAKLKCTECIQGEYLASLLNRMITLIHNESSTLTDEKQHPVWPPGFPDIDAHIRTFPKNANPRTIASYASLTPTLHKLFEGKDSPEQIPVGSISVLVWVAYLRHNHKLSEEMSRLWYNTPPSLRPKDDKLGKLLADMGFNDEPIIGPNSSRQYRQGYIFEKPATIHRCEGTLCRIRPAKPQQQAVIIKWRPSPKNFAECKHCAANTPHTFGSAKFDAAIKVTNESPRTRLPPSVKSFLSTLTQTTTQSEAAGIKRPQSVRSLGHETGYCARLWELHLRENEAHGKEQNTLAKHAQALLTLGQDILPRQTHTKHGATITLTSEEVIPIPTEFTPTNTLKITHGTHKAIKTPTNITVNMITKFCGTNASHKGMITTAYMHKTNTLMKAIFPERPPLIIPVEQMMALTTHAASNPHDFLRHALSPSPPLPSLRTSNEPLTLRSTIQLATPTPYNYQYTKWPPPEDPAILQVTHATHTPSHPHFFCVNDSQTPTQSAKWIQLLPGTRNKTWRHLGTQPQRPQRKKKPPNTIAYVPPLPDPLPRHRPNSTPDKQDKHPKNIQFLLQPHRHRLPPKDPPEQTKRKRFEEQPQTPNGKRPHDPGTQPNPTE